MNPAAEFDIIVYGASGFTGRRAGCRSAWRDWDCPPRQRGVL